MSSERTFRLEVLTLQRVFLEEMVRFVIAPGQEGQFEILPDHAPFVFALQPGVLHLRRPSGADAYVAIGAGFLVVQRERTTVLTRSAEWPEEIDVARAERARDRAMQRLRMGASSGIDVVRAQAALQRALARLRAAEYAEGARR